MKLIGSNEVRSETPLANRAGASATGSCDNAFAEVFSDDPQLADGAKTGATQPKSLASKEDGRVKQAFDDESAAILVCGTMAPTMPSHYALGPITARLDSGSGETAAALHPASGGVLRKDASCQVSANNRQSNETGDPFHSQSSLPEKDATLGANLPDPELGLSPAHASAADKTNPQPGLAVDPKISTTLQLPDTEASPVVAAGFVNLARKSDGPLPAQKNDQTAPKMDTSEKPSGVERSKTDGKESLGPNAPPSANSRMADQTLSAPVEASLSAPATPTQSTPTTLSAGITPPPALTGTQPLTEMRSNGLGQDSQDETMALSFSVTAADHAHLGPTKTAHVALPEVPQSISRQITTALMLQQDRPIELTLSPEELGKVRLTLTTTDIGLTVSIVAERSETLELMRRNIDVLDRDFRELGYENTSFNFGHQSQNERSEPRPDPAHDITQLLPLNLSHVSAEPLVLSLDGSEGLDLRF